MLLAVERLSTAGIRLEPGLSVREFAQIEETFGITFGTEHRTLLSAALPIGPSWVDWRRGARDELQGRLSWPIDSIIFDVQTNGFWPTSWGPRPDCGVQAEA